MKISLANITKLRLETSAGIMDCKKALVEAKGSMEKAKAILKQKGLAIAAKKADKKTEAGRVEAYTHLDGRAGALLKLSCETDFVSCHEEFKKLAHELCLQVTAMKPKSVADLLKQEYIREPGKTVRELLNETIVKMGENIKIEEFCRLEI